MSPLTKVWQAMRKPCFTSSSDRCFLSLALMASVCSTPFSMRHLQVPQRPPPHLKGMPPCSRSEMRSRLPPSGAETTLALLLRKVIWIMDGGGAAAGGGMSVSTGHQHHIGIAFVHQVPQRGARQFDGFELLEELDRHVVDDFGRRLVDHRDAAVRHDLRDHEARLAAAEEEVVGGLDAPQALDEFGAELPGLAGQ